MAECEFLSLNCDVVSPDIVLTFCFLLCVCVCVCVCVFDLFHGYRYVPTLAEEILHRTTNQTYSGAKLDGIAVGNGCSGNEVGTFLYESVSPRCRSLTSDFSTQGHAAGNVIFTTQLF